MLLLNNDDVKRVLEIGPCMDALEEAYRAQAAGRTYSRPRTQLYMPLAEPGLSYCLKTTEGALLDGRYATLRLTSDVVSEAAVGGVTRRTKVARGPGETYCGLIMVFSAQTLEPVALLHDGYLQLVRVACTSALGARLLARPDATTLGLLGTGGQAWMHLMAMSAVRKLGRVRIHSPNPERCGIFAERARQDLGLAAEATGSAREAVEGADLVVAATNTSQPIVDGAWIAKGAFVVSIVSGDAKTQRRELDDETVRRAARVISHSKETARLQRHGDLWCPVEAGILQWDDIHDLSEVIAGKAPGRSRPEDIMVFKNNVGIGLQFAAVAPRVYELARAKGIGRELPSEWFLQKMKP
ncbi:MAG: ornithine cyclodeaminase family protein [Betaproteobacteria bacterium]|nr:ornithine cyclodeaminase family protein [Betaproteobacteria bacterium]